MTVPTFWSRVLDIRPASHATRPCHMYVAIKTEAADLLSKQVFANITAIDFLVGAIEGLWHVFVGPQTLHSGLDSTLHYVISFFFPTCVVIWGLVWHN